MFLSQDLSVMGLIVTQGDNKPHSGRAPPTPPRLEAHKGSSAAVKGSFTAA